MEIEKHNNIRSKQVITSPDTLHSSTTSNNKYRKINDESLDNETKNKILSIKNTTQGNSKKEKYNHRKELDKSKIQEETTLQHHIITTRVKVCQRLDNQRKKKEKEEKNEVYKVNEKQRVRKVNNKSQPYQVIHTVNTIETNTDMRMNKNNIQQMSNNSIELIQNKDNEDKYICHLSHEKIKEKSNNYIQQQLYDQGIDF